jgi:hypothetical protein
MKVEVYGDVRQTPRTHIMWRGNLSALPRPDDFLVVDGDLGAFLVRSVTIACDDDAAEIKVWMSISDEEELTEWLADRKRRHE